MEIPFLTSNNMQLLPLSEGDASPSSVKSFSFSFHSDGSKGFARIGGSSKGRCEIPPSYYRTTKNQPMLSNLTIYHKAMHYDACEVRILNPTEQKVALNGYILPALRKVCSVAST